MNILDMDFRSRATFTGSIALFLWILEPVLVSELTDMPAFEALTLVFLSCFIPNAIRLSTTRQWHTVRGNSVWVWLIGVACVCGADFAYLMGAHLAPIAHVDLIDYMWPCFVVLFIGLLPNERLYTHQFFGILIMILGICVLIVGSNGISEIDGNCLNGYLLALYSAVAWGMYSAFSRLYSHISCNMISAYCGVGVIISLFLHLLFEVTVIPTVSQLSVAVLTGLTGQGLAYQLWDYGIKHGNVKFLSTGAYLVRILAMALLVIVDKQPLTVTLIVACLLASVGVFITSLDIATLEKLAQRLGKRPARSKSKGLSAAV